MPEPQPAINRNNRGSAIFMTLLVQPGGENTARVRAVCGALDGLVRSVAARDANGDLSAIVSIGAEVWERLFGGARPAELHPFIPLSSNGRNAPTTPGDILIHMQSERQDLSFELASQIMAAFGPSVRALDELHGFRYFDDRDLIGFVDGTENPKGDASVAATIIGAEDAAFAGGSYVITQKYIHNLPKWHGVPVETQESIIGRTKLDDIELADDVKPSFAHNALNKVIVEGEEVPILRHNMPFGNASGEQGTFFIAYARSPRTIEQMLENMFIGSPPGNYDHLLDFTTAITGTSFFAPSLDFLAALANEPAPAATAQSSAAETSAATAPVTGRPGMLAIGSLKGVPQNE